jgi:hypothetical protein
MKFEDHRRLPSGAVPAWFHSFPPPSPFSPLWALERIAALGVPVALISVVTAAIHLGWIAH